jgi:glycosyltransferase involved in cell wall biosynthesis
MLISIIVPTYNESKTIIEILQKVKKESGKIFDLEVIVVDDGSTDNTEEILKENVDLYDSYLKLKTNQGKGAAVKKGLSISTGDYILFQDADLEYNPSDYKNIFNVVKEYEPDVVIGSRFKNNEFTKVLYFWNKLGNKFLTMFFNLLFNTTFTDIYSCYFLYKKDLVDSKNLRTKGFNQQAELLSKAVRKGKSFYEVPISYNGRTFDEGKKIKFYHAFGVITTILKNRFKPL